MEPKPLLRKLSLEAGRWSQALDSGELAELSLNRLGGAFRSLAKPNLNQVTPLDAHVFHGVQAKVVSLIRPGLKS